MPERLVFFLKSSGPTFLKARNVSGLLLPASITVKAASASSCGTGKSSLGIHNRAGTIRRPASSQHFFTLSVQTRLFKCFCWTSADGWQKKTCVHLTCRRHLLFLPLPPHTHTGEPRSLRFWPRRTRLWPTSRFLHHLSSQGIIKLPGKKNRPVSPVSHNPFQTLLPY